jgi:subtilisin family serine protease
MMLHDSHQPRWLARLALVALLLLTVNLVPGVTWAAALPPAQLTPTPTSAVPVVGEIVVQPKAPATIAAVNARYQTTMLFQFTDSTAALVQTSDLNGTLAAMAKDATIDWFEANNTARQPAAKDDSGSDPYCGTAAVSTTTGTSAKDDSGSDPYCTHAIANGADEYADQWADYTINLRWAQRKNLQGQGVTIAVLDTQVEMSHPALAGKLLPNLDLVPLDPQSNVTTSGVRRGHGTFVAGVALHVAPAAKVLPVHVLNEDGHGSTALVAEGIRQAAKAGAQVINMSLSTPTPARALQDAVAYAQQKGVVMVAAYGNEGLKQPPVYPANFGNVISVVATDDTDIKAPFTNYGDKADVAAPGVNIVAPWRDGQYGVGSGTSFSTPIVSGEAAVLLSSGAAKNSNDVVAKIMSGTENIDKINGGAQGYGRINLPTALLR